MQVEEFLDGLADGGYWDERCEICGRKFRAYEGEDRCEECSDDE